MPTTSPLGLDPVVVSVSLGATRTVKLRPNDGGRVTSIELAAGDLLVMGGATQSKFTHAIGKRSHNPDGHISLTFRCYSVGEAHAVDAGHWLGPRFGRCEAFG